MCLIFGFELLIYLLPSCVHKAFLKTKTKNAKQDKTSKNVCLDLYDATFPCA